MIAEGAGGVPGSDGAGAGEGGGSGDGADVDDGTGEDVVGAGGAAALVTVIGLLVAVIVKPSLSK